MVWLYNGEKIANMFTSFDRIHERDGRRLTDEQTDRQTDRQTRTLHDRIGRAMHRIARRIGPTGTSQAFASTR